MYISRSQRARLTLKNMAKTSPHSFVQNVSSEIRKHILGGRIEEILFHCNCSNVIHPKSAVNDIKNAVINDLLLIKKGVNHSLGNGIIYSLKAVSKYLNQTEKNRIIDSLLENNECFYSYSRKNLADVLIEFTEYKDNRAFSILNIFLRTIETKTLDKILAKIDNGIENPDVKKILTKTKKFSHTKYNQIDVKTKPEVRRALIKEIANTTSIVKKLPFEVEVSLEDIKELPPAARLSFLQKAYKPEIYLAGLMSRSSYYHSRYSSNIKNSMLEQRLAAKMDLLKMPKIEKKDLEDLLFSVALQKNEEMTKFVKEYSIYLEALEGTLKPKSYSY